MEQGCKRMMAMHLLMGAHRERYGSAIEDFECAYLMVMDKKNTYPKTFDDAYILLKGWKKSNVKHDSMKPGVSFNIVGDDDNGTALVNQGNKYNGPPCS